MSDDSRAPQRTRVIIADDSGLAREVLRQILSSDPGIEVVGVAADGATAIEMVVQLEPDIVTMDLRMPGLDGLATTAEIMARRPTPVLIVTSSSYGRQSSEIFEALKFGIVDLIEKPRGAAEPGESRAAQHLIEKVKLLSRIDVRRDITPRPRPGAPEPRHRPTLSPRRGAVGLGASTGGPRTLVAILSALPPSFPVPLYVAQHLSAGFTAGLVHWLEEHCPLPVRAAEQGERPVGGQILVAPGGARMTVEAPGTVRLKRNPSGTDLQPSVDQLFTSLARTYERDAIGVVLTGMGRDGVAGLRAIRRAGGVTLAQHEEDCVVPGMPRAAIREKVVDEVLPADVMASRLQSLVASASTLPPRQGS